MEFLDTLQNYWAIILFCGTVIGSWVRYESKITNQEKETIDVKNRVDVLEKSSDSFREEIKVDIREIKTTMNFVREALIELKKK